MEAKEVEVTHMKESVFPTGWRQRVKCDKGFESTQISFLYFSEVCFTHPELFLPHAIAEGDRGKQQLLRVFVDYGLYSIHYVANTKCFVYIRSFSLTTSL